MIQKIINKIKLYKPSKTVCLLYFFMPIIICAMLKLDKENDIWFLLNHGKYVIEHGFPTIEPFSMHQGFSFVMQQWLSAVIFYLIYNIFGKYGLWFLVMVINSLILYFLYKLCMKLSDNRFRISIALSCISDILLLTNFITLRPFIFTELILIIILYIMESFYQDKNCKLVYLLPLISLLHINLHASMWFMLFLFMLPYLISFIINKIKNKTDNRIFKLLIIMIIMFLVGFINPYGIKNMMYVFTSYGSYYINKTVVEMTEPALSIDPLYFYETYITLLVIITIYIVNKKGKLQLRHMLLLLGVSYLAITAIRNFFLLIIGGIPFIASYTKNLFPKEDQKITKKELKQLVYNSMPLVIFIIIALSINKISFTNDLKNGIDYLLEHNNKDNIVLYTNYFDGSYAEYRGLKPYIDTRAEIFLKANNKKEDIIEEYYYLSNGQIDYKKFINKYKFTHLIVSKDTYLYDKLSKDKDYKMIYKDKKYKIFETSVDK